MAMNPTTYYDLDTVRHIGGDALHGLKDKAGNPMFWHASDMAYSLERQGHNATTVATALLHDVLEDTSMTPEQLHGELVSRTGSNLNAKDVVANVRVLTRSQGRETYAEYIDRIKESSDIAGAVKAEDLKHHLKTPEAISDSLRDRYTKALAVLTT